MRAIPTFPLSTLLASLTLAVLPALATAAPPAQPLPKSGACPSGYHTSGKYCVPNTTAKHAVEKSGSCPSGYYSSGKYCVASSDKSRTAIPRVGSSCPSGYYRSGDYCVSSK